VAIKTNSKTGLKIFKIAFALVIICGWVVAGGLPVFDNLQTAEAAQYARPDGDQSVTNWTGVGASPYYDEIDESSTDDDTTYTQSPSVASGSSTDDAEFTLIDVTDPAIHTGHTVRYRWRNPGSDFGGGDISFIARLMQGGTTIASQSHSYSSVEAQTTYTTSSFTLTTGEAANITNYNDLRIKFDITIDCAVACSHKYVRVTWAELEVPDVNLDLQVGAGSDDANENGDDGSIVLTNDEVKNYSDTSTTSGNYRAGGFRWTNVTIPPGATITAAYISIYSTQYGEANVDIYFHDVDNPGAFTTSTNNITNRTKTTASTSWADFSLTVDDWNNSPSIVSVVQEIVDRGDWTSGDPMVALFIPKTDLYKRNRISSYEATDPSLAAKLHIEYTPPGASPPDIVAVDSGPSSGDRTSFDSGTWYASSDVGGDNQVSFTWTDPNSPSGDTFYYEYNTSSSNTITGDESTTTNNYVDDFTLSQGNYYFHVRPKNGDEVWGTERVFNIKYDSSTPDISAVDSGPSSGDRTSFVSGTWYVASDVGGDDQASFTWTDPSSVSDDTFYYEYNTSSGNTIVGDESTTTNNYVDDFTLSEGNYYFHVRPKNGAGTWGTERVFNIKYDSSTPDILAVDAGPSNVDRTSFDSGTWYVASDVGGDDQASFTWTDPGSASDDTFYYEYNTSSGNTIVGDESSTGNNYVDDFALSEGNYYFHVRPQNGAGTWGTERTFNFKYDKTAPTNVGASTPADSATDQSVDPTLTALTATDATSGLHATAHYFELATDTIFTQNVQNSGWIAADNWQPSTLSNSTDYYWRVKARDAAGNESVQAGHTADTSGYGTFTTEAAGPDIVAVDAGPSSGDRTSFDSGTWYVASDVGGDDQASFTWTDPGSPSGDTFYYEYNTSSGDTIVGDESTTTNNYVDDFTLSQGNYYFHVRPKNGLGTWGTERVFNFKYDKTAPTNVGASTPADSATDQSVDPTLTALTATDATSGLHATAYYFELATDTGFTQNVQNSGWIAADNWQPSTLSISTVYYWRVKARDAAGNESVQAGHTADTGGYGTFTTSSSSTNTYYRSVGTGGIIYQTGTATCSASTTVTFSGTLPSNVGEGDKLTLDVDGTPETKFILTRDSDSQVTVQSAFSGSFTNQDFKIERAYASLSAWESDRQRDLTAATGDNSIEVAVCYADGDLNDKPVISGWTTGPSNYIKIYAPSGQRHNGTAGTGFVMKPSDTTGGTKLLDIGEEYVRVEGIEIDGSSYNDENFYGLYVKNVSATSDIRFDKVIIHDLTKNNSVSDAYPVYGIYVSEDGSVRVTNCIIYDIVNQNANASATAYGIQHDAASTSYFYNNTIYNVVNSNSSAATYGFSVASGTVTATNNFVGGTSCSSCGSSNYDFSGSMTQSYNISEDTTATGTGSLTGKAPADQFVSTTAGLEDLHLKADADCLNVGNDLSGTFTDDVDGETRPTGAGTWDIGADEYFAPIT
jgi:type 1 glutamine amidotransferase